jgi:BlaI family transcriptional regulator, penicillinase repressor
MPRPKSQQPTDGELEILRILWEIGPAELGPIRSALLAGRERDIALTTVATMLKVMLDKGLVTRARGERAWLWSAKATRKNTTRGMIGKFISTVFEGSASKLVMHLIEDGKLSPGEREEIRALLDEHARRQKRS